MVSKETGKAVQLEFDQSGSVYRLRNNSLRRAACPGSFTRWRCRFSRCLEWILSGISNLLDEIHEALCQGRSIMSAKSVSRPG